MAICYTFFVPIYTQRSTTITSLNGQCADTKVERRDVIATPHLSELFNYKCLNKFQMAKIHILFVLIFVLYY